MVFSQSGSLEEEPAEPPAGPAHSAPQSAAIEHVTPASVVHDAAARLLDVQISASGILDTRNANIFSISSTVLPLTFGLLSLGDRDFPDKAETALVGALICYVLVLVFAWVASVGRGLEYRPTYLRFMNTP